MSMSAPLLSRNELKRLAVEEFSEKDPILQTLSTHKHPNSTNRSNGGTRRSRTSSDERKSEKLFRTSASIHLPLRLQGNRLIPQPNTCTSVKCILPPTAHDGRWSATFGGSSIVRGPIGCASGNLNVAYHFSRAQLFGGMSVGDQSHATVGGSASSKDKRKRLTLQLKSAPNKPFVSTVTARCTKSKLWCANANISLSSAFRTTIGASLSTLTTHRVQLGFSWLSSLPKMISAQLRLNPKLSERYQASITFKNTSAGWKIEGDITQYFQSKLTALVIAVSHVKRRLLWTFSWRRGDVVIHIPILISTTTGSFMYYTHMTLLPFLSGAIQATLTHFWSRQQNNSKQDFVSHDNSTLMHRVKEREDAEQQKRLMSRQARNRVKVEEEKNGLIVRDAVYQVDGGDRLDVTTQLQFWTNNSTLELPASSKAHMLGFYNVKSYLNGPAPPGKASSRMSWWHSLWEPTRVALPTPEPTLSVRYEYSGEMYDIVISDSESLLLPSSRAMHSVASSSHD